MKKYLSLVLFFVLSANNALGSPLIFKFKKVVSESGKIFDLSTVDTSKYKQVRIHVEGEVSRSSILLNEPNPKFEIWGIEDGREFLISDDQEKSYSFDKVLDSPPSQIKIKVKGEATYYLYIWGQ